jgi:ATP-dependent DNA ligase
MLGNLCAGDWIYEIKFDGYRALALRGGSETRVLSRNEKDLGKKFPEINDSIAALDVQDAMIDGEIVALDEKGRSSFQLLQATQWTRKGLQSFSTHLICSGSTARTFEIHRSKNERRSWKSC